jgi:hypothetical protein
VRSSSECPSVVSAQLVISRPLCDVPQVVDGDVQRLKRTNVSSAEYSSLRSYLELVSELPWWVETTDRVDINAAKAQLNHDHFGMDKVTVGCVTSLTSRFQLLFDYSPLTMPPSPRM